MKTLLFLKKKKQKDFIRWLGRRSHHGASSGEATDKVFWFFCSQKNNP